ncbi:MAG: hypothetical protein AUJ06_00625 [Chloroflexi bacterium 13_1_40CM_3_70_6]|nr:MAG: hypothetical protein AUJ06_00625 [Chloroflexi bacterium 13_1_40CM_3_70_6]
MTRRLLTVLLTVVTCLVWLLPATNLRGNVASAQTLANGLVVSGDFRGAGYAQIASLYDPGDNLGLRISVLDHLASGGDEFSPTQWFQGESSTLDLGRMKVAATDVDFDGKTDIVALYDDGGTSVRLLVWKSTGTSFAFQGTQGWWRSDGYAWSRTKGILAGNFSGAGKNGLLSIYQYDNFQMRIHYFESNGSSFVYGGDQGVYDSGPGQYDTARARFAVGHFTRPDGPDQIASIYQYPSFRIRVHVFNPSPKGLVPINGWAGVWESSEGTYDLSRAKVLAADFDGDKLTDLLSFYWYADGSVRVHVFNAARGLAFSDATGVAQFAPFTMPFLNTQLVAGDWNKDGFGDLATLTSLEDGSTHVGVLRSTAAAVGGPRTLQWSANQWVTPPTDLLQTACSECWPLTGIPTTTSSLVTRRPLAVKIDNAPAARPHHGISQADMVVELLVEGFITRLAAYFHSQDPVSIGAVRSVRFSDRYTTPMVRGVLVFSGGSQLMMDLVTADIANGLYVGVSPQLGQGNSFLRSNVDGKVVPHNLFTSAAALRRAANDVGGGAPVAVPRWGFLRSLDHAPSAGGFLGARGAVTLAIPYRADAAVRYDYDPGSRTYARYQSNGSAYVREVDGANGVPIAARNIVIINTDVIVTDVHDDAGGAASLDMRLVGTGRASIFRDGRRQEATWYRGSWQDPFAFYTEQGERVLLSPGQTWMHILPVDWTVPSS